MKAGLPLRVGAIPVQHWAPWHGGCMSRLSCQHQLLSSTVIKSGYIRVPQQCGWRKLLHPSQLNCWGNSSQSFLTTTAFSSSSNAGLKKKPADSSYAISADAVNFAAHKGKDINAYNKALRSSAPVLWNDTLVPFVYKARIRRFHNFAWNLKPFDWAHAHTRSLRRL